MSAFLNRAGIAALSVSMLLAAAATAEGCRQALALGLDVSLSVDPGEFRLQRQGLATALSDAQVITALTGAPGAQVDLAVFEWSGAYDQRILIEWTTVTDQDTVARIAADLVERPQLGRTGRTAIGSAMTFGKELLLQRAHCDVLTLDISGDGMNNNGTEPGPVRKSLAAAGIQVNALLIASPDNTALGSNALTLYYENHVIVGPNAFTETIFGFDDYADGMRRKLLRELTRAFTWHLD